MMFKAASLFVATAIFNLAYLAAGMWVIVYMLRYLRLIPA